MFWSITDAGCTQLFLRLSLVIHPHSLHTPVYSIGHTLRSLRWLITESNGSTAQQMSGPGAPVTLLLCDVYGHTQSTMSISPQHCHHLGCITILMLIYIHKCEFGLTISDHSHGEGPFISYDADFTCEYTADLYGILAAMRKKM